MKFVFGLVGGAVAAAPLGKGKQKSAPIFILAAIAKLASSPFGTESNRKRKLRVVWQIVYG